MEEGVCLRVQERFSDYLEESLPLEEKSFVAQHLAQCPTCNHLFADFQELVQTLHNLPRVSTSPDFESRLQARIAQATATPWWRSTIFKVSTYAVAAGLVMAFLFTQWMVPVEQSQGLTPQVPLQAEQRPAQDSLTNSDSDSLELITPKNITPPTRLKVVNQTP